MLLQHLLVFLCRELEQSFEQFFMVDLDHQHDSSNMSLTKTYWRKMLCNVPISGNGRLWFDVFFIFVHGLYSLVDV